MRKYFTTKKINEAHYEGLKPDQARALYLISEAGTEGLTDAQLAQFNEKGEPVAEGEKGLKVKTALLVKGLLMAETVPGERKGSERTYAYTGAPIHDGLSASLQRVGNAVAAQGTGTKSQFAAKLAEQAAAAGEEMTEEKAVKTVNGVWLRMQDLGIVSAVKKSAAAASEAPQAPIDETGESADAEE